ncbi:hypothetical protein CPB83DRAFT_843905 [Crepidotus variabilis]|uniref:Uncharacterized protein n=1 Tax=Crepidotus variabilis TaxID=179855 RepID=A0A9P6ESP7_9AGAR|nr:hypothetical protein CPB83DRAFT_843905 [Crepidotus variabilis]
MEYKPRFSQPFTLEEALLFEVPVITEEISRLENSLKHLQETQDQLRRFSEESETTDPDITKAYEENQVVIGSQEERISILKMALMEKGLSMGPHYQTGPLPKPQTSRSPNVSTSTRPTASSDPHSETVESSVEDGSLYL